MKRMLPTVLCGLWSLAIMFVSIPAFAVDEDVVFVRKDCSGVGANQTCFTNFEDLQTWLWNTRNPTATSRVSIHIGPGTFFGTGGIAFDCPAGQGFVSLIGSGPDTTKIHGGGSSAIRATNCTDLHVQDLSIISAGTYAIRWLGGGTSRWVNVDVSGTFHAWLDNGTDCGGSHPIHYWFNSRLEHTFGSLQDATYKTECGESWFYGSELTYLVKSVKNQSTVIRASGDANVRAFGSVLRAVVPTGTNINGNIPNAGGFIAGVRTFNNAQFHMHGGIISLNVSPLSINVGVSAIEAYDDSVVHTPETAFVLKPSGTGAIYRTWTYAGGRIESPFMWPPASNPPPLLADPDSSQGADVFVETDCDAGGDCDTAAAQDQRPHLMVFTAQCTVNGPWFDVARNKCRGEP